MENKNRPKLIPPCEDKRVLLHCCCAPCSGDIIETMLESGINLMIFFYNPNIYPLAEYERRKGEVVRFAERMQIPYKDADYDYETWAAHTKGWESEPERGKRCTICFGIRLKQTALFAHENNFRVFTSSVGISRWKDMQQVNECGKNAAAEYPGLAYWDYNWRKEGGAQRMYETANRENFYKQLYCGCIFSQKK